MVVCRFPFLGVDADQSTFHVLQLFSLCVSALSLKFPLSLPCYDLTMEDSTKRPCVSVGSSGGYSKRSDRSKRGLALSTVHYFLNITSNFDDEGRSKFFSRISRHPDLQGIMKKTIFLDQAISEAIVENMKTSLRMVKGVKVRIS